MRKASGCLGLDALKASTNVVPTRASYKALLLIYPHTNTHSSCLGAVLSFTALLKFTFTFQTAHKQDQPTQTLLS